jgi:hypothetical protein
VSDARNLSSLFAREVRPDPLADSGFDRRRFAPVWSGMLQEFRNHISRLGVTAGTADRDVQSLASLVALIDASLQTLDPIISKLDDVVARAVALAAPVLGPQVTVTTHIGPKTGIKNCGSALECLLAALLVDLSRGHVTRIHLQADVSRGSLEIELDCDGQRPLPDSWRFLLACDLADKLGATITSPPDVAAYVVHFR